MPGFDAILSEPLYKISGGYLSNLPTQDGEKGPVQSPGLEPPWVRQGLAVRGHVDAESSQLMKLRVKDSSCLTQRNSDGHC
jgi:hypothetical protein